MSNSVLICLGCAAGCGQSPSRTDVSDWPESVLRTLGFHFSRHSDVGDSPRFPDRRARWGNCSPEIVLRVWSSVPNPRERPSVIDRSTEKEIFRRQTLPEFWSNNCYRTMPNVNKSCWIDPVISSDGHYSNKDWSLWTSSTYHRWWVDGSPADHCYGYRSTSKRNDNVDLEVEMDRFDCE